MDPSSGFTPLNPNIFNTLRQQHFSIPFVLIHYISKHPFSTKEGLLKLHQTCKYFFSTNPIVIIDKHVRQKEKKLFCYFQQNFVQLNIKKYHFWITEGLSIENPLPKRIFKMFYRCNLKSLLLRNLNISFKEFNFLLNGNQMNEATLLDVNILDETNAFLISCDQILKAVPKIRYFNYSSKNERFSTKNFEKFYSLVFENKFNDFKIAFQKLSKDIDIMTLFKFIEKNSTKISCFTFEFKMDNAHFYKTMFRTALNESFQDDSVFAKQPYIFIL